MKFKRFMQELLGIPTKEDYEFIGKRLLNITEEAIKYRNNLK